MNKQTFEYWYENRLSLEQRMEDNNLKELLREAWDNAYFVGREEGYDEGYREGIHSAEEE
jgi:flagellar biosynthesis/type III secretory pathway protein FliH